MTDRDFDQLLYEGADQIPPGETEAPLPSPWRRAMGRVCWGIVLNTITLNFWYLNCILPAVGVVLLWLGFRAMRRENGWFLAASRLSVALIALRLGIYAANAAPLRLWLDRAAVALGLLVTALLWTLMLCLWRGLRRVFRKAGQKPRTGAAGALAVCYSLMLPLALLGTNGLFALGFIPVWIAVLVSLFRLTRSLAKAGYALAPAPVRLSDRWAAALWLGGGLLAVAVCLTVFARLPVHGQPVEPSGGQEELRAHLLELGFPEDILADLSDEDVAMLEGAWKVELKGYPHPPKLYDSRGNEGSTCLVHIYLDSYDGYGCAILYYFDWETPPERRRMEGLEVIPAQTKGVFCTIPPAGRMLWEEDGASYAQPLDFRYGRVRYNSFAELVYHESDHSGYYADFSLPASGGHIRGYALWTVRPDALQETWFYYTCNYIRRDTLFSYPYQLPSEYARSEYAQTLGLNHDGYSVFSGVSACDVYHSGQEGHLEAP